MTVLRQLLNRADYDNDEMLSLSDFVRFSGRPLLEQYSENTNISDKNTDEKVTESLVENFLSTHTGHLKGDDEENDTFLYEDFLATQAELRVRLRRSNGTYVPASKTSVLFSVTDAQKFAIDLKKILLDEDRSEELILDYQQKFDFHSHMLPGVITSKKEALYARCKVLGIMYGWCHPSLWEYEHNLELYQEMAKRQMEIEQLGTN